MTLMNNFFWDSLFSKNQEHDVCQEEKQRRC